MQNPDARSARAFLRAALRSKDSHVRHVARAICRTVQTYDPIDYTRRKPFTRADEAYNLADRAAIDLAARVQRALAGQATQGRLC
jgi:hypothetical protein